MANEKSPTVLRDMRTLFHVGTSSGLTDAQLLDRFRDRSDQNSSEAAFAGLMARHGPMVLGVCRRALRNPDDVADAFQATFLILVRKADTVRVSDSLGRWLYGVSRRVSVRAKLAAAHRSVREVRGIEFAAASAADADLDELRIVLDEEIGRLPEKFRSAVVLCELEGRGHDEAARHLGCAVGTVKSRLSRARQKLRSRLIRRGVAPTTWALWIESGSAAVPAKLTMATAKAAVGHADGVVSPAVTLLIQGALQTMLLKKLSMIAITVVASVALATSAGVLARQAAILPAADQPGGQRLEKKVRVENEAGDNFRSAATDLAEAKKQEDESIDRIELLRLDVQLLEMEVQAREGRIKSFASELIQIQSREGDAKQTSKGDPIQLHIENLRQKLQHSRKEYISKKRELRQKQSELAERLAERNQIEEMRIQEKRVQEKQRRALEREANPGTAINKSGATRENSVPVQPAAPNVTEISPSLGKRLSTIEGKLDSVLKAMEDLKREMRQ